MVGYTKILSDIVMEPRPLISTVIYYHKWHCVLFEIKDESLIRICVYGLSFCFVSGVQIFNGN